MKSAVMVVGAVVLLACAGGPAPATPAPEGRGPTELSSQDKLAEGEARLKDGNLDQARVIFEGILKQEPDHPRANHYLGVVLDQAGDAKGAEAHYRRAIALSPGLTDAIVNLSALLTEQHRYDDAVVLLRKAISRDKKDPLLRTNLGFALAGKGDADGAVDAFEKALLLKEQPNVRLALAEIHLAAKHPQLAIEQLRKAQAGAKADVELLATIAEDLGRAHAHGDCVAAFDKAISIKDSPQLRVGRGMCRRALKDHAGAKEDYEKAIALDGKFGPAYYLLGQHLWRIEKDKKKALEALDKCAVVAPQSRCKEAADKLRQ